LEDFALISPGRHSFYLWLTGGLAATSLALIVFVPSLNTSLSWVKWLSVAFFIASMLFGITSHLVLRELEVFKFEGTQKTTNYHHTSLAVSLISFAELQHAPLLINYLFWGADGVLANIQIGTNRNFKAS
jgi:hypothetical protein